MVRGYQVIISPVLHFVCGPFSGCRFTPTCSQFFIDAVRVHGSVRGSWLGLCRICRCHPWGRHGHDPVPGWKEFVLAHPEYDREPDENGVQLAAR